MPRCESCNRQQASVEVRKMPGRDAYRCKDKFDCELAESNRDPYTARFEVTFPAKSMKEAWEIIGDLPEHLAPYPTAIVYVEDKDGRRTHTKNEAVALTSGPAYLLNL